MIAGAVEEQTATTSEIGQSVAEAAKGSTEISKNISDVAQVAENTRNCAGETEKSTLKLTEMARELNRLIAQFDVGDQKEKPVSK